MLRHVPACSVFRVLSTAGAVPWSCARCSELRDRNTRLPPSFFYLYGIALCVSFCHGKRLVFCDLNTLQL